jgi:hypothetical protein
LSPAAGAAGAVPPCGIAVCAIIASANSIVTATNINFVLMISSSRYELFPILAREDFATSNSLPPRLVSGHDFSRAAASRREMGLSP